ncbi:acetate--CoA ligase family protein [Microbacterium sp. A93]|uniref:acetate--CoA ligase family protein n=1 Tax=Microbacterium sp. A93 TaxID=3450716 RepID=UPI003F4447C7
MKTDTGPADVGLVTDRADAPGPGRPALDLGPLFAPRSIALIGASATAGSYSSRSLTNLRRTGYSGSIFPVNPRYTEIDGLPCYPTVGQIGQAVDAAMILVRSELVHDAVRDCVAAGVKVITVCSAGFAEEGAAGHDRQRELVELARAGGSRLVGPNCIGAASVVDRVVACATLNITETFTPGSISIVSQSGGMAVNLFNRAQGRGVGIRGFVSVGNEADLDVAQLVEALADDEQTRVIALFIEELRDVPAFRAAVSKAHRQGKPVLVLKAGRSEAGARSSLSHTGALAGSHALFSSVMTQLGVLEVDSVDTLIDTADLLARVDPPASNRLLIVSPSGGECSYAADRASELGLRVPALSETTVEALSQGMRFGAPSNPFDLTGQVIGNAEFLRDVLGELERADEFDLVLYAIPTWSAHDAERLLPGFIAAAEASTKPTVISAWTATDLTERSEQVLAAGSAAHFGSVDAALSALAHLARWAEMHRTLGFGGADPEADPEADLEARTDRSAPAPRPTGLPELPTEHQAKSFLREHGLDTPREVLVSDRDTTADAAAGIGWPLVAKQLCEGVVHKSDLGLVRVGVRDQTDLDRALDEFDGIVTENGLVPEGLLLSELHRGLEVILGGVRDPQFGPMVMIGAGGILAELLDDTVFRSCPLGASDAEAALDELSVGRLLRGYRAVEYDRPALVDLIVRFSELFAGADWLDQADLNPVLVAESPHQGAVIVDAALVLTPPSKE